jgi:PHD/YefM family antitoxin component YafN of YafNO toxin-antitoxin module
MMAFEKKEIVSATQLVRQFSNFLTELTNKKLKKIAIIRNNEMQAVVLPIDEYENLVLRASLSNQKSVKDFFGSIDKYEAAQMEAAVAECRRVDENEW